LDEAGFTTIAVEEALPSWPYLRSQQRVCGVRSDGGWVRELRMELGRESREVRAAT
jgi:hypothetical protein